MSKREEQRVQTRQRLFDAALQAYEQKGFLNTSIDDVTQGAGVSHGNFFVHYARREDLIIKAIEEIGKTMYERFLELAGGERCLGDLLGVHLDVVREYESIYFYLVAEGPFLPEQARNAVFILQNGIGHWMRKSVEGRGLTIPFHSLFNLWMGNLHYYLLNRDVFSPGKSVIDKYRDEFIQTFQVFERSKEHE